MKYVLGDARGYAGGGGDPSVTIKSSADYVFIAPNTFGSYDLYIQADPVLFLPSF